MADTPHKTVRRAIEVDTVGKITRAATQTNDADRLDRTAEPHDTLATEPAPKAPYRHPAGLESPSRTVSGPSYELPINMP